ncbi:hypothetical protein K469DRAFT_703740 [Zopfia rhizophila CBS 207.26]|uniref:Uncharacterized protein n=1 Tax=Zopfia rhizophila CBS 207.26 TaxID=1314779 RepID=A0A6A6E8X1_9PEZI|nr:hypothetical protein K469DRAFT_703740 [Zopfia rhizophila CBS 207.26]
MTSATYVYIPNLVGRQILRVPITSCEEVEAENQNLSISILKTTSASMTNSPSSARSASLSPSIESIAEDE